MTTRKQITNILTIAVVAITFLLVSGAASAATISVTASAPASAYDLTTVNGVGDWAYWDNDLAGAAPLNSKIGASLIGDLSVVGAGELRSTTSADSTAYSFTFTDGTSSTETSPRSGPIGMFHTVLDLVGKGVQLDVVSPTADAYTIYLWSAVFQGKSTLKATIGATNDSAQSGLAGSARVSTLYTIEVDPDTVGETVNLQLTLSYDGAGTSAHTSLGGIAVDTASATVLEEIVWYSSATTNITMNSAWAKSTVDTDLTGIVLV